MHRTKRCQRLRPPPSHSPAAAPSLAAAPPSWARDASGLATRLASSNSAAELEGTITKIGDVQKFDSRFEKIEFVVTTAQDPSPQDIKFELLKIKIELLDAYVDQEYWSVSTSRGNEWQGRHFVNLQAWRLHSLSSPATASPSSSFGGAFCCLLCGRRLRSATRRTPGAGEDGGRSSTGGGGDGGATRVGAWGSRQRRSPAAHVRRLGVLGNGRPAATAATSRVPFLKTAPASGIHPP